MSAVTERTARGDRFGFPDLLAEAAAGIGARPGRLLLTILGTVLGIASMVVTVGLAQTASSQINKQFDAIAATQALARPETSSTWSGAERALAMLPWDAPARAERLAGVEDAGTFSVVDIGTVEISAVPVHDPSAARTVAPDVLATSPGALDAVRGRVIQGRYFDSGHDARADRVVVLGVDAAQRLGVVRVDRQPSIFIGDRAYQVIGIVDDVKRRSDVLTSVVMPEGTARADFALAAPGELHLHLAVGAGPVVAGQLPTALNPNAPETIDVQAPPATSQVRQSVQADVNTIFLALGGVALLIGGVGIANVTLLSVLERVGEIGLRRALGATRRDIGAQFMVESVVVGLLGGMLGAALGVAVVVGVSAGQDWTPVLDLRIVGVAAVSGGVIGLLAGLYPSLKASSIEPIAALRGGV
ncbi:ABC transporter permease [Cellulomonas fengjieae]|uniref:ABC transporter permease n=1 Tax=Cellulomonas fengjieae TaxID=2819978 RepID=A0ABS3SFF6_9CELL|nr:ABC transporter permease [Cellulomonas fengjieae]MBO3083691.1 ABC transporter permease [Cellulomonas fengjieae]QVI65003.1 ABC transporter permease [Cellulomonas fengjieae]